LARLAGRVLDAEQVLAVDALLSYGPGGRWVALESAVVEARQNGKTGGVLLPVVLFDLFLLGADRIVWTAHLFKTARDAFADAVACIDAAPELSRRVKKVTYANGEEAIELTSGARLEFLARSKGGGRGLGGKRLVMDEALFLAAEAMGALIPTLSARQDPQINYASSAGKSESDHLRALRDRGRAGGDQSLVWVEWCAPGSWDDPPCADGPRCAHTVGVPGCALDDEELWPRANPTLGRRITYSYVRSERRSLPAAEFGRERLGWYDEDDVVEKPILEQAWAERTLVLPEPPPGPRHFFLDCSPGLVSGSIGVAVDRDGVPHLELADYRARADWVVARAVELRDRYPGCVFGMFAAGAASALLQKLDDADIHPHLMTGQDMGRACAHLQKLVAEAAVTHSGDVLFAQALGGAVKRDIGDDLWAWSRRKSADISPIVTVTGAAWLLETHPAYDPLDSVY
jgi:hypothetical protein